jgi:hypothetical protein
MAYNSKLGMVIVLLVIVTWFQMCNEKCLASDKSDPPKVVYKLGDREGSLTRLPDGRFMLFKMEGTTLFSMISADCSIWSNPKIEIEKQLDINVVLVLVDKEGELHSVSMVSREVPEKPGGLKGVAITRMLDLWHRKTTNGRSEWEQPQRIFEGYCGAVLDFKQLRNGRLIVPFAYWVAGQSPLPRGLNISTVVYSDDGGNTWKQSDAKITAPTYKDYPGNNYGAVEPVIVELEQPGNLYMLMRSQTGFLYESYSTDNGTSWLPAVASRFYSYNGPPLLKQLPDKRIFMVWNNSDNAPKYQGKDVYGGRDAIHAAISDDYGKTWRGFREIHRDPLRNETPPKTGDRGTAYANSPIGVDKNILLITGMGVNRRHIVYVDTEWLTAKHHESDFSKGLEEWTVFKQFGSAARSWRDRVIGPRLVEHPSRKGVNVLHIRRPDEKYGDGAVWNFPNGQSGKITIRIMLNKGFKGGIIALTDRFFNPCDVHGERLSMFNLPLSDKYQLGTGPYLSPGKWYSIDFIWDIKSRACTVNVDSKKAMTLNQGNGTLNGLSYLRFRSTATEIDVAGFYVESVVADIYDNLAPRVSEKEKLDAEANYRKKLIYDE